MKILVLTNEYPNTSYPKKDSPWTVPFFTRKWASMGHDVVVVVNSTRFPKFYYSLVGLFKWYFSKKYDIIGDDLANMSWTKRFSFVDQGVRVYNLPMLKLYPSVPFLSFIKKRQLKLIANQLDQIGFIPDIITGHWLNPQFELISRLKNIYNCQTGFVFESDFVQPKLVRYKANKYKNGIDRIGCRSRFASEELKRFLNLEYTPFICASGIPDEIVDEISEREVEDFENDRTIIVSAGRFVGLKRFDSVIKACNNVYRNKNFELTIAGEGPLLETLREYANHLESKQNILLPGKIERSKLFDLYKKAQIFILISEREAFGLVYLEAMSQGCIVIASRDGGIDGIVKDGVNGFICEAGNADELAEVLTKIKNLTAYEKKKISDNAINTAREYSDTLAAKKYLNFLLDVKHE